FTSSNGEEALQVLGEKNVDVIICDVMMPKMDGYELHHLVRGKSELAHIPFLFLTALSDSGEVIKGKETGADDYLVKPFDPQDLLAVVKGKVNRSRNLKSVSEEKYDSYRKKVIHTLSHEFRTPLVAINTGTELLLEQHGNLDTQKVQSLLEAIRRGGHRLERLVNDFMLLQQIEAGIATKLFETRATDREFSELVEQFMLARRETLAEEGGVCTFNSFCKPGVTVHVYEPHIHDILWRLLSNAVKFSPDKREVELCCYTQESDAVVEVRDRGIGMDIKKVREAIDAFGQIDRDKLEQQGGGLGLAIANRYALINKGRLEFECREGGGTVCSLFLPQTGKA
ncbi:MAG: hybrid sensor histidine kinase/response regulator, partial [Oligoflexia bacterium]|nr:hybrid sensor histidine kinase/response regulator [Oligoflexia bacterium]